MTKIIKVILGIFIAEIGLAGIVCFASLATRLGIFLLINSTLAFVIGSLVALLSLIITPD